MAGGGRVDPKKTTAKKVRASSKIFPISKSREKGGGEQPNHTIARKPLGLYKSVNTLCLVR
jgi:hypothetical protein